MDFSRVYFLGIGGIGMSALARYFIHEGVAVAGYDLTPSALTAQLEAEGAQIHYDDNIELIPEAFRDKSGTMVVYTPAVPADHSEMVWFTENGFCIEKRSQMLGHLTRGKYVMAVAGTHGKTTTTTLLSWLNTQVTGGGSAFLGGISRNFDSNLVLGDGKRMAVEADEFDRSFLRLEPDVAVITSADADHLDIYGTHEAVKEAFTQFARQIHAGGALVIKQGVDILIDNDAIDVWRYSCDEPCDFHACNIRPAGGGRSTYDIVTPDGVITECTLGTPGRLNIENSVAAVAMMWCAARALGESLDEERLRKALADFEGVKRRMEFYINTPQAVYIDDYAHHPRELTATLTSIRDMFPGRRITVVFQPHLYTRTRDLCGGFAEALSLADEVVLLPIYPARELPIEGVTSRMIGDAVTVPCRYSDREHLAELISAMDTDITITFGAGNIDACCKSIAAAIQKRIEHTTR